MDYLKDFERKMSIKYADSTKGTYLYIIKQFLKQYPEPAKCTVEQIENYLLQHTGNSRHRQVRGLLQYFFTIVFNQAFKFKHIPYPPKTHQLPKVIDKEFLLQKINAIQNIKHKCILKLAYGCGLRISEIINLKPANIDSKRMLITIVQGKGRKDRQTMLPDSLLSDLRIYYKQHRPKEYLFEGQWGGKYSKRSIQEIVKQHLGPQYHIHQLRHSFATHLHEAGIDIKMIKELLGHANIKTTEIYTHVSRKHISGIKSPLDRAA